MRISDWSSDVCPSDLTEGFRSLVIALPALRSSADVGRQAPGSLRRLWSDPDPKLWSNRMPSVDRKSVVSGKSVSVRVDLGGRRTIKQKNKINSVSCTKLRKKQTSKETDIKRHQ